MIRHFNDWLDSIESLEHSGNGNRDHLIRVEERIVDGILQIRAEMPGVDPSRDIEINIAEGILTIIVESREEVTRDDDDEQAGELRYRSLRRSLQVPRYLDPASVSASYEDGILAVDIPLPAANGAVRIPVQGH